MKTGIETYFEAGTNNRQIAPGRGAATSTDHVLEISWWGRYFEFGMYLAVLQSCLEVNLIRAAHAFLSPPDNRSVAKARDPGMMQEDIEF